VFYWYGFIILFIGLELFLLTKGHRIIYSIYIGSHEGRCTILWLIRISEVSTAYVILFVIYMRKSTVRFWFTYYILYDKSQFLSM
jgi:hypothetical protein